MESVTIQGNILTYDILQRIASDEEGFQAPKDYGFSNKSDTLTQLETNWGNIKMLFSTYQHRLESLAPDDSGVSLTRKWWMSPFLSELGYDIELNKSGQLINDRNYFVSHQDNKLNGFPIHIIGANQSLDKKYQGVRMSAHALIQEYLNHHENLYALVTNGRYLRLLRDSQLLTKVSYVEFDLHKMITEDQFADFVLLWKLLHVSRMPEAPEKGPDSIIEQYHLNSLESGSRIRDKLSEAVKHGINLIANGLIQEQENVILRDWLQEDIENNSKEFYSELLRIIYRILFIMVIEERDLIYTYNYDEKGNKVLDSKTQKLKTIYYDYYSIQRIRRLAVKHYYGNDRHYDLWQYLLNNFSLYQGTNGLKLGIQALAGDLFSQDAIQYINSCELNNQTLLQVFKGLTLFENDQGQYITVNYKSLDVEEFGSVYEGLLELDPAVDVLNKRFNFAKGEERSISGSHYTPDELVQPLIKHSLEHLISDILKESVSNEEKINKLLRLSVCDVACGSGHILLSAARRIGLEIARLKTGEEQPNPEDNRRGTREAIKHCIYGVDKNPLAVELCKVAMWLEAHLPGEPLNFLDHKIKNGDAIVGLAKFEELESGIHDEAFKKLSVDDSDIIKELKKQNKEGRNGYERIKKSGHSIIQKFKIESKAYEKVISMPETTVDEIESKKEAYTKLLSGAEYLRLRRLADLKTAQFFITKTEENKHKLSTNTDYYQIISGHQSFQTQKMAEATAVSIERKFFHWFLEFPEVFSNGGFNCILGNPPFLGDRRIKEAYGVQFLEWIRNTFTDGATIDLVGYFFLRINEIIKQYGFQSLISTNTITQGKAREKGLEKIISDGSKIIHAVKSMKWPGLAAVEVSLLTLFKGEWKGVLVLDNAIVKNITPYLDNQESLGNPFHLKKNDGRSYQGSIVLGMGFVLEPNEALRLLEKDENKVVIQPYLNGSDLNSSPTQSPSRYVINFHDWQENIAANYKDVYDIINERVKPERQRWKKDKNGAEIIGTYALRHPLPKKWWQHAEKRPAMYDAINTQKRVLVSCRVSKYVCQSFVEVGPIFDVATSVVIRNKWFEFAGLQNSMHQEWAWKYASTMKFDIRYTNKDCIDTFPIPEENDKLNLIGKRFHEERYNLLGSINLGLTKMYNQFHNKDLVQDVEKLSLKEFQNKYGKEAWNLYNHLEVKKAGNISYEEAVPLIFKLRKLHKEMDQAVLEAYGWHQNSKRWGSAINLRHDFYEVDYLPENDRVRYTIHPDARKEVLKRLLLLNHEIHESEVRGISYEELDREKIIELYREEIGSWLIHPEVPHPKTIKYLAYGEDLLPDLERKDIKEYSPYVTEICKAIENEILQKLFIPFNAQFQEMWQNKDEETLTSFINDVSKDARMRKFSKNLKNNNVKYTLGDMHFILNLVFSTSLKDSLLLQEFKDFVFTKYDESFINKETMKELDQLTLLYRNASAHADENYEKDLYDIDKATALECRGAVRKMMNLLASSER